MIRRILVLLLLLAAMAGGGVYWLLKTPYSGFSGEAFVDIPPGTSTREIATLLQDAGVIRSELAFLAMRAIEPGASLQAGEYRFEDPASVSDVFRKIARGEVFYYELVVPEGSNMFDVAASLEKLGVMKAAAFLQAARSPSLVRDLAPEAPSLEGYLFPSTYRITRRTSPQQVCRAMTAAFRKVWHEIAKPGVGVNRTVTLASLVEKETGVPAERPAVAAVFSNRLNVGMKLDCDPTTIYAALLRGTYRGKIYRSDLDNPHPYNTYQNPGLPPGPIANPGLASLRAALQPADVPYLYFVAKADGSGGHIFSENLAQHALAVQNYRRSR